MQLALRKDQRVLDAARLQAIIFFRETAHRNYSLSSSTNARTSQSSVPTGNSPVVPVREKIIFTFILGQLESVSSLTGLVYQC